MRNVCSIFVTISNLPDSKHVIFSYKLNMLCFLEIRESKFAVNHVFEIAKTLWMFMLKSIELEFMTDILVSSANNIGTESLFIILCKGKGKGHRRTGHKGPEVEQTYSSTLPSTSVLDGGVWSMPCPGRFTARKDLVPIV